MLDNIQYIIKDTGARLIISNNAFKGRLHNIVNTDLSEILNIDSLFYKTTDNCHHELLKQINSNINLPAMILYTSGTTKLPKGVTLSHKNLLANTASILQYLKLGSEDSILATINFSYSYGNSILLTHTAAGGKIIIENRIAYPVKIIEQLYSTEVTGFSTVGSYINTLLKQEFLRDFHLKALKYITFAGESTSFEDILKLNRLAPDIKIFVMYGQTEATARLSYLEPSMLFSKPGSIGKGIPGVTLLVVTENGEDVNPGQIGEIIAFGDNIMMKYWNNEAETQSVIKSGWLHTNDLATVDEDGFIYVKGRKDDIIKYMGHRISPAEIEEVINSCKFVLESAVIGVNVNENKQIKAYIVTTDVVFDIEELNAHIKGLLPPFKRPHIIEIIEEQLERKF
jgi:acyl-coenzyme A synthetase/AMP-(fatty) acid ligase